MQCLAAAGHEGCSLLQDALHGQGVQGKHAAVPIHPCTRSQAQWCTKAMVVDQSLCRGYMQEQSTNTCKTANLGVGVPSWWLSSTFKVRGREMLHMLGNEADALPCCSPCLPPLSNEQGLELHPPSTT